MSWFHKLMFWKSKPAVDNGWFKKIIAIRGEVSIGLLSVDVATYDQDSSVVPVEGENFQIVINPALRPTVNRVLAGEGTEEDTKVIELALQKLL